MPYTDDGVPYTGLTTDSVIASFERALQSTKNQKKLQLFIAYALFISDKGLTDFQLQRKMIRVGLIDSRNPGSAERPARISLMHGNLVKANGRTQGNGRPVTVWNLTNGARNRFAVGKFKRFKVLYKSPVHVCPHCGEDFE